MEKEILRLKFVGSLIGTGLGDALGRSMEGLFITEPEIDQSRLLTYTDDTQMTIGVAESLIQNRGFNGKHMTRTFIRNYQPHRGYGPGPPRVFRWIREGESWDRAATRLYGGLGSFGNGSSMRVAPVGLFYYDDSQGLRQVAHEQSRITHTHPLGIEGAVLQAYAVAMAANASPDQKPDSAFLERLKNFTKNAVYKEKMKRGKQLLKENRKRRRVAAELGNGVEAYNSVPTAIFSFLKNRHSFQEAIRYAIGLGGDTDTIGAMTGAISGAYHGVKAIPQEWIKRLEDREYIEDLANKLWAIKIKQ